jgi:hypothetical protein
MRLNSKWRLIMRKAWSIKFILLAGFLTSAEAVVSAIGIEWLPAPLWVRMGVIATIIGGAFVARLIAQQEVDDD